MENNKIRKLIEMKTKKSIYSTLVGWATIICAMFLLCSCVAGTKTQQSKKVLMKQCLDCHPEFKSKFTSGIIHDPVKQETCFACHRPHGLYGKIVFIDDQPNLCYGCHEGVKPAAAAKSVHEPLITGSCTECHLPHNSSYASLLKDEGAKSCFACHAQEPFQRKTIHEPLGQGCDTCHVPHSSDNIALLKLNPDESCRACHDVDDTAFLAAHFGYPVSSGCIKCHTPHSSDMKGMLKVNVHPPVLQGECDACHMVGADKKLKTSGETDALCAGCHEIHAKGDSVHEPYVKGQCTTCHDVHASDYNKMFADEPGKICLSCHAEGMGLEHGDGNTGYVSKSGLKIMSSHKPVVVGQCLECHKGHTSDQSAMLSQERGALCYKCHAQESYSGSGGSHRAGESKNCDTCHVPHTSTQKNLLLGEMQHKLCFNCHKDVSIERGKFSQHKPFSRGECSECHKLHRPEFPSFLKKSFDTGELCLTCHEKAAQQGGENYFNHYPVSEKQCSECHAPHAADYEHVMLRAPGQQCYVCHEDIEKEVADNKVNHNPVKTGKCTECHSAHGSAQKFILKQNQPILCVNCHKDVAKDWVQGYPHKPSVKSCLDCHNSHGSDQASLLVKPVGDLCSDCHDVKTDDFRNAHGGIIPKPGMCISCHDPHGSKVASMLYPVVHSPFGEGTCTPCHEGGNK